jgi:hypothetical protein
VESHRLTQTSDVCYTSLMGNRVENTNGEMIKTEDENLHTHTKTCCGVSDENRDLLDTLSSIIISMIPPKSSYLTVFSVFIKPLNLTIEPLNLTYKAARYIYIYIQGIQGIYIYVAI